MRQFNIADLRSHLSEIINFVIQGQEIEITRRNLPVAKIIPIAPIRKNKTKLGCALGTVKILDDLTEPFIADSDWSMLK